MCVFFLVLCHLDSQRRCLAELRHNGSGMSSKMEEAEHRRATTTNSNDSESKQQHKAGVGNCMRMDGQILAKGVTG